MITKVKGSSGPLASDILLDNGDTVQEFYQDFSTTPTNPTESITYSYSGSTPIWSGSAKSVDVSGEAGFIEGKPCYVISDLTLSDGSSLGTTIDLVFPNQLQLVSLLAGGGDQVEFAFVTINGGTFSIVGSTSETRLPITENFKIIDIRQVP